MGAGQKAYYHVTVLGLVGAPWKFDDSVVDTLGFAVGLGSHRDELLRARAAL